jgi:sarcosine oxidase subunit gamma
MRWQPRGAWEGHVSAGRFGLLGGEPGVHVTLLEGLGLATLIGCDERRAELTAALSSGYGVDLPEMPRRHTVRDFDLIWAGPDQWLVVSADRAIAAQLAGDLDQVAAVSDQSDARAVLRLTGPRARDVLAKGCPLDLHPRAFRPGDAALTAIAHVGVHLWQIDGRPTYDLAVFRSMAASFSSWLLAAAAEFGCEVRVS